MINFSPETIITAIVLGLCLLAAALILRLILPLLRRKKRWVILDGSNVMHWKEGKPDLGVVFATLADLKRKGFTPGVVFDANAGYLLTGRYLNDGALSRLLKLPKDRVIVIPKGTPADPAILRAARDLGARVVTNDRFKDWADEYPEVRENGHLISGRWLEGKVVLNV